MKNNILSKKYAEYVTQLTQNQICGAHWSEHEVFTCELFCGEDIEESLTNDLQLAIKENTLIDNDEQVISITVEYYRANNQFFYYANFEYDIINITNFIKCDYLDNLILEVADVETCEEQIVNYYLYNNIDAIKQVFDIQDKKTKLVDKESHFDFIRSIIKNKHTVINDTEGLVHNITLLYDIKNNDIHTAKTAVLHIA